MHKKSKRIRLKSVLIYNINNVLEIARKKEQKKEIYY